jgi:hypothetical protein
MEGFRNYLSQPQQPADQKWKLSKPEIISYWKSIRYDLPIVVSPIRAEKKGSTYNDDGIRITGSKQFIDSVLGKLKDLLRYENLQTKLDLVYRQTQYKGTEIPESNQSFAFYVQVRNRINSANK